MDTVIPQPAPRKPAAPATERAIVASLLEHANGELPPLLARILKHAPHSFDDTRHGALAESIRELRAAGEPIYADKVAEHCREPGTALLLAELPCGLPLALAELEAETLWKSYQERQTRTVLAEALAAYDSAQSQRQTIIAGVRHALDALESERSNNKLTIRTPDELLAMSFDDSDRILADRMLATGQSLVIAGQGSLGKSRLLLQLAVATITSKLFVGLETRRPDLRWLILQVENSNRRLQADLAALREWAGPAWAQVNNRLFIHTLETDTDGFLALDSEETQRRIADAIRKTMPGVVGWDSLFNFGIGDLNSDQDMAATLVVISRLTKAGDPARAPVVLHHALTGRAGAARATGYDRTSFSRNSKLLHQWARAQINVAPGSPDSNDVLVLTCGKCSNGQEFPPFAVRLNPQRMIYEPAPDFDLAGWQADVTGKKSGPDLSPDIVREVVAELARRDGAPSKAQIVAALKDETGCGKTAAYDAVDRADRARRIHYTKATKTYVAR